MCPMQCSVYLHNCLRWLELGHPVEGLSVRPLWFFAMEGNSRSDEEVREAASRKGGVCVHGGMHPEVLSGYLLLCAGAQDGVPALIDGKKRC